VPIAAGTDTPIGYAIPGYSLHRELELLVRAGLSPIEALGSATLGPAAFFGLDDDMGAVEEGRLADLVLLTANPLDDIANTQAIEAVVARGRVVIPPR
jgi:imidazolonepropionase-like amidohydrolase